MLAMFLQDGLINTFKRFPLNNSSRILSNFFPSSHRSIQPINNFPSSIRNFSSTYKLTEDLVEFKFVRSSGPGGQNVNKVSSACEARLSLSKLEIPAIVKARLLDQQSNRINTKDEIVVDSQEDRSQHKNKEKCLVKLQEMIDEAYIEPKIRIIQRDPPEKTKQKWREEKTHRKSVKEGRRKIDTRSFKDDY